jgi:hypothetical protein
MVAIGGACEEIFQAAAASEAETTSHLIAPIIIIVALDELENTTNLGTLRKDRPKTWKTPLPYTTWNDPSSFVGLCKTRF